MYGNPQRRSAADVQDLRREGGRWLKGLRERGGMSQRQLAAKVRTEHYTFVSQLETGRGRIPPDRYLDWADALGVPAKAFVREILRYYDPITYDILFQRTSPESEDALQAVEAVNSGES
jgi:transcriptional regulator with XRE-family HTH domain